MTAITSFHVDIPQSQLDDLYTRLDLTRWPDELPGVGWDYGIPLGYLKELAGYWRHSYDWRAQERLLNSFPHFTTDIDGARVHFMHARSARPDALPLLLTHGWPGSVAEFLKVIAPLRQDFHVVVPSIPGYGLSGPTRQTGWDVPRIARAWAELMSRLGYRRYGLHGGDWGAFISRELGRIRAEHVTGVHLTFVPAPPAVDADALSEVDQRKLARKRQYLQTEYGYGFIQATKPQTLAYGLTDSPVGQLAWIVEKFKGWTDSTDVPEDAVDRDQMLTNIMLYWLTGTAGSAARLYRESAATIAAAPLPSSTPTGVAQFPRDQAANIRPIAETLNNITRWTEFDRGGHFPAMEEPDLLVADIQQFFGQYRH